MGGEAGDVFTFLDPEEGREALRGKVGRDRNVGWAGNQASGSRVKEGGGGGGDAEEKVLLQI